MSRRRSLWSVPAAILAATTFAGAPTLAQDDPEKLVIGFVPSVEAGALVEDIEPLAGYLTEALGIPVEGFVSSDYAALVTAMETDQAQIAALPPYGLVQAVDRAGAEVILQSDRFGSTTYHTQFMTTDTDKYCADEPVVNERQEGEEMLPFLNCNGTARAFAAGGDADAVTWKLQGGTRAFAGRDAGAMEYLPSPWWLGGGGGYTFPSELRLEGFVNWLGPKEVRGWGAPFEAPAHWENNFALAQKLFEDRLELSAVFLHAFGREVLEHPNGSPVRFRILTEAEGRF